LEATIKNLTKEIAIKARESSDLQRSWIKGQTELVELMNSVEKKQTQASELGAQKTILEQKLIRTFAGTQQQEGEIKQLQAALRSMQTDMSRLNELIAKNTKLQVLCR
jgi:chromosome segregation ATPase